MTTTTYSPRIRFMSLYTGMLRRNMGSGIYLTLALLFFYPLQYLMELMNQAARVAQSEQLLPMASYSSNLLGPANNYTAVSFTAVCFLLLAASAVLAVAQNSYMHSRQASDLYHSLPLTRSQLMCVSTATVFTIVGMPVAFCQLLVLVIGKIYVLSGTIPQLVVSPVAILQDLLVWLVAIAAIITVMMLVSTLVGSAFENFILGCELLIAGPLLLGMCSILFQSYLVGYIYDISAGEAAFFSPVTLVLSWYGILGREFNLLWPLLFWFGMVIILFLLSLWLYSRRKSELAETTGVQGILGFVTRAIAVCIGSAVIGGIFAAVSGGVNSDFNFVIGVLAGAALTIFLMEGVFGRGFQGIKRILPQAGVLIAGATVLAIMLVSGGLGYETRIPALDDIQDVTIDFRGRYGYVTEYTPIPASQGQAGIYNGATTQSIRLSTPRALELVREYHQALISTYVHGIGGRGAESNTFPGSLSYRLSHGRLKRSYGWNQGNTQLAQLLLDLEQTPEFREVANPILRITSNDLRGFCLEDRYGLFRSPSQQDSEEIAALLSVLQTDMREEDYRRYNSGQARIQGYIYIDTGLYAWNNDLMLEDNTFQSFYIPVLDSYHRTITFLQESGLGEYLLEPDTAQIISLGISNYDPTYTMNIGGMYGQAGRMINEADINDKKYPDIQRTYDLVVEDETIIRSLLAKAKLYRVGEVKSSLYLTVMGPRGEGLTLWLAPEYLPEDLRRQIEERIEKSEENELDISLMPTVSDASSMPATS